MSTGTQRTGRARQYHRGDRPRHDRPVPKGDGQRVGAISVASAKRQYERYLALAGMATSTGDTAEIENLYQHAEHYFRLMREQTA